jgi:hypothetical protein
MTRSRKVALVAISLLLLSQIPFVYRRYKLGRLKATIQQINASRTPINSGYAEYKGVIHVHSSLGGHSSGTFAEIISAAQTSQLHFVVMTEHTEKEFDTAEMTLKGVHSGVIFVNGNEVSTANGDRLLVIPGQSSLANSDTLATTEVITNARSNNSLAVVAYPEEFKSWNVEGFDGIEVYNVFTNSKQINPIVTFFDALWSYRSYPDLLFATFYRKPGNNLKKWDELLQHRKLTAIAGNDAHSNIGISLNDRSGKTLAGIKLDPYETSFRLVRMHVLVPRDHAFDIPGLLGSLKAGHCFIAFDLFGDPTGFSFTAEGSGEVGIQGDEVDQHKVNRLKVISPVTGRILIMKDGSVVMDESGVLTRELPVAGPGAYRVEVYLPQLGKGVGEQPWIISNPIYVR